MSSTGGESISLGTPEVELAIDAGHIIIPLKQVQDGKIIRSIVLAGDGKGLGAGIGISIPFVNFGVSPTFMPGVGTPLWQSPFSPQAMEPNDFKGVCWVLSASHTDVGVQGSASCLLFCAEASIYLLLPTSVNAVGAGVGTAFQSAIVNFDVDAVGYMVRPIS